MDTRRLRVLREGPSGDGPVVYWMSRDQRTKDNWALWHAQDRALSLQRPLMVVFTLADQFLAAKAAHYAFMMSGLKEVRESLAEQGICFFLLRGEPPERMQAFLEKHTASLLVVDFDPLRIKRQWKKVVLDTTTLSVHEVDAHNVVPCWTASPKQEFGAYTLRPKILRLLPTFLPLPDPIVKHPYQTAGRCEVFGEVGDSGLPDTGESAAHFSLQKFIDDRLSGYADRRNNPLLDGTSGLSSYLHFGQLYAGRVAHEVMLQCLHCDEFLEELIVRRELADNYCHYNLDYDNMKGFPAWAQETLNKHRTDPRPYLYSLEEFEHGLTHDPAWNAAQRQMTGTGKMHGYMRMYWAKKILEWTSDPETAVDYAIHLNDRYEMDGRDPNGYTGIAWSIGGVHDRPWPERPVFGKIRSMVFSGLRRKFDVEAWSRLYPEVTDATG